MDKLKIENLDLYYEKFHALKGVNLSIPRNRIAAFIGPSGCGKSTLLKTLNRMNDLVRRLPRSTGKVLLDGDGHADDRHTDVNLLRKRVGMVFQKPNPFPMSVYDNIAYGPRTHGIHGQGEAWTNWWSSPCGQAAIWDELKDRLQKSAAGTFRRPAAEAVHRAGAGGSARGAAYGRADICA